MRTLLWLVFAASAFAGEAKLAGKPWHRYTIDDTSQGADGVKLIDVNTDGRPDVVTGWEEGGVVRAYFNPSRVDSKSPWRQVTVGRVKSPEDAVFADLDGDLRFDVVSACEGNERAMFIHWAPKDEDRYWDDDAWRTDVIPASRNLMMWMFAVPMQVDGKNGMDIVAGGKGAGAAIGWWEAPKNPRDMEGWKWHPLRSVGWIMSIYTVDMDGDHDLDILFSDRKGGRTGVYWLENPGGPGEWHEHEVGSKGREVMFIDVADADGDGKMDVIAAVKPREVHVHQRRSKDGTRWESRVVAVPEVTGTAKSVRVTDVNGDGTPDLLYSAEQTPKGASGVIWMNLDGSYPHDVSGPEGVKYDLLELVDLDGDGDLDVLTTEEVAGLGVVWYENPGRVP
ncbi:MAG: VCBS repeat-containing protein [Bryobacteraceae bacterium]